MEIKHEAMEILLSIKPKYVKQILNGLKRVEFRKQSFKFKKNLRVFIYSSSPEKMLVAYFTVKDVQKKPIQDLWEEYSHVGGIDEEDFFKYFKNKMFGYAIEIDELKRFSEPVDPYNLFESFTPPQSYQYLRKPSLKKLEHHIEKVDVSKKMHEIYFDKEKTKPVTDYEVAEDGYAILNTGRFYVFGETKVYACDNSIVHANNDSWVWAFDKSVVYAYDNSIVWAYEDSKVWAYHNSKVWACHNSTVLAHSNSKVEAYQNSTVYANDNSIVFAYENSKIIDRRDQNGN